MAAIEHKYQHRDVMRYDPRPLVRVSYPKLVGQLTADEILMAARFENAELVTWIWVADESVYWSCAVGWEGALPSFFAIPRRFLAEVDEMPLLEVARQRVPSRAYYPT